MAYAIYFAAISAIKIVTWKRMNCVIPNATYISRQTIKELSVLCDGVAYRTTVENSSIGKRNAVIIFEMGEKVALYQHPQTGETALNVGIGFVAKLIIIFGCICILLLVRKPRISKELPSK